MRRVTAARIASTSAVMSRLRRDHRRAAGRADGDRVDEESVLRVDRLVAGRDIGLGEQGQELVGAGAADDAVGVEPVGGGDRLAQRRAEPSG